MPTSYTSSKNKLNERVGMFPPLCGKFSKMRNWPQGGGNMPTSYIVGRRQDRHICAK